MSNKNKIGILTFHRAYNYGAILQVFALQKAIEALGVESEVIDYLSQEKRNENKLFSWNKKLGLKGNAVKFFKDIYRHKKNKEFDMFMEQCIYVSRDEYATYDDLVELEKQEAYKTYIVGSDQVWNLKNNRKDKSFLLSFVDASVKRCSYAASIGHCDFDEQMDSLYSQELNKFRVLTVREESSITEHHFLSENNAKAVLDPTLIVPAQLYNETASPRIVKDKYAFLYTIADDNELRKYAESVCKEKRIKLIDSKKSVAFMRNASPRAFLSFIKYADYVFTNSFHGTVFSIIMHKQLITEINTRRSVNNRSKDLMYKAGILDRDMNAQNYSLDNIIDWDNVEKRLKPYQIASKALLSDIVSY